MAGTGIKILAFGMIAETIASTALQLENIGDTDQLTTELVKQFPSLKNMKFSISVNRNIVNRKTELSPGCEVALLPPFSGG